MSTSLVRIVGFFVVAAARWVGPAVSDAGATRGPPPARHAGIEMLSLRAVAGVVVAAVSDLPIRASAALEASRMGRTRRGLTF